MQTYTPSNIVRTIIYPSIQWNDAG